MIEFTNPELDIVDGRQFATQYTRVYNEKGEPVEIYDRPVYEGTITDGEEIGSTYQVFFNGSVYVVLSQHLALNTSHFRIWFLQVFAGC